MKKITTLIVAFVVAFSFTSCNDDSLQGYLVESQEKDLDLSLLMYLQVYCKLNLMKFQTQQKQH